MAPLGSLFLLAATPAGAPGLVQEAGPVDAAQEEPGQHEAPTEAPPIQLALVGGVVHTQEPGVEPRVATILVAGDRVVAVGEDLAVPEGVDVLDVAGRHVVPGLIDSMVGFDPDHDALYLRAGVTLVRDIGSARMRNLAMRDIEVRDSAPGPALLTPGAPLDGDPPVTPEAAILRDVSAAEALLPIVLADEPDYLSILQSLPVDVHAFVHDVAAETGLDVWGPVPRALSLERAIEQKQRGIFFLDSLLPQGVDWAGVDDTRASSMAELLGSAKVRIVPAMEASALRLVDPLGVPGGAESLALLAPSYELWWTQEARTRVPLLSDEVIARGLRQQALAQAFLVQAHEAGAQLVPGTGAPNPWLFPGTSLHAELQRWVDAGLDRSTVLDLATRRAAEALGVGEERGIIGADRIADLLVVAGDPRVDLAVLQDPETVVLRGKVLPREALEAGMQAVLEARNAERTLANMPIEVPEPPRTEGGRVVLSGHVESWAVGQRIAAERFNVERLTDGTTRYVARMVEPGRAGIPTREMIVRQDVRDNELVEFSVAATDGANELVVEGLWTAQTLRLRTLVDGVPQPGVQTSREHIVALDVGTATSFMILAQRPRKGTFPVMTFHEGLTPEVVRWELAIDAGGDFQVGTPTGPLAFRIDEKGAPTRTRRVVGRGTLDGNLLESNTSGGPGHPLPAETAAWIQAQAAEATARLEEDQRAAAEAGAKDAASADEASGGDASGDGTSDDGSSDDDGGRLP